MFQWLKIAQIRLRQKHAKLLSVNKNHRYSYYLDLIRDYLLVEIQERLRNRIILNDLERLINRA